MPTRLDWRVGPRDGEHVLADPSPTVLPRHRARWPATLLLLGLYGGALLVAAAFGFGLGRWQESRDADLAGLSNQLALEDLAWGQGDRALYASTLDPSAAGTAGLLVAFARLSPLIVRHEIVAVSRVPPDRAAVRVRVDPAQPASGSEAPGLEDRHYRLEGRSWLRTDPP